MKNNLVNTGIDLAFKLVLMNKRLPVSTVARVLNLNKKYVERLFEILEKRKMLRMKYKIFGETEVMVNGYGYVNGPTERMRVFDWVVECPKKRTSVRFKTSCQNCKYLKDVEGKILNNGDGLEFRPENVICSWRGNT
ncbi:MAG: hypothetical protein J7K72_01870 [Candidatus Aenigmarchaeota archaeon]|nr:hypothetical protein [Candidatus Aenigmarchaeota archaeon]